MAFWGDWFHPPSGFKSVPKGKACFREVHNKTLGTLAAENGYASRWGTWQKKEPTVEVIPVARIENKNIYYFESGRESADQIDWNVKLTFFFLSIMPLFSPKSAWRVSPHLLFNWPPPTLSLQPSLCISRVCASWAVQSSWKEGRAVTCKEAHTIFEEGHYSQTVGAAHSLWNFSNLSCQRVYGTKTYEEDMQEGGRETEKRGKNRNYPLVVFLNISIRN